MQIDQRKLDAARIALGTKTETDTVDAALDAIAFRRSCSREFAGSARPAESVTFMA